MADDTPVVHEYEPHERDYGLFLKIVLTTVLSCGFTLVALLAIGFAQSWGVFTAVAGLVVGFGAVTLTLMTGGRNWVPCVVLLVLYFLFTATLF